MRDLGPSELVSLLAQPERVNEIPEEAIPDLVGQLECLKAALWTRMIGGFVKGKNPIEITGEGDRLLTIEETARALGVSKDWVYRRAAKLPFTVRLGHLLRFSNGAGPPATGEEERDQDEALSPAQVAALWNLKPRYVQHLCRTGRLPAFKPPGGKVWRIPKIALDKVGIGTIPLKYREIHHDETGNPPSQTRPRDVAVEIRRVARRPRPDGEAVGSGRPAARRSRGPIDPAARGGAAEDG